MKLIYISTDMSILRIAEYGQSKILSGITHYLFILKTNCVVRVYGMVYRKAILFRRDRSCGSCSVNGDAMNLFCATRSFQHFNSVHVWVVQFSLETALLHTLQFLLSSFSAFILEMIELSAIIFQQTGCQDHLILILVISGCGDI
ncbi:hypothetical protein AVEN_70136-1 [Araneus ventricosus]|uniref:Uncharacterized protein n=1 Tax=Araneus ventricosus TaxID=182803 RepID=A0A4Y2EIA8_ARAVE|nr:hypothetical protein AVEN_70136-1 [Araneus ventricosus]